MKHTQPGGTARRWQRCHATASQCITFRSYFFLGLSMLSESRRLAAKCMNCCTYEDALKSIVISIEMVELVKCLLPPVQNEHISWWFDGRSCQAVFASSHTQIRSMLRCLKAWHRSDMILVPVWLQSVFNLYLHQWSMIHNLKGNTHVDLHLSSPVYTDKPILSSYHLDKLKNWVCSQWMAWLFGSLHKSFSAWASSTIVEGISCFWKPRTMVVFKRGISYDCQRILMNIQTPEEVRRKKSSHP